MALHRVFRSPQDKIIFDVSHQCYAHKILTGRGHKFSTLRATHGLSGFTSPRESPHDIFFCGHAGTALSSALGMAVARDQLGQDYHVIAVIGDASLTNGLTLEALNNIGKNRLIIVLNDNGYAISENVGSIAKYLNGISRYCFYNNVKNFLKKYATRGPLGRYVVGWLSALKGAAKALLLPSSFFEHHGLKYIGPVDGHNVAELIENLQFCKEQRRPMLLHVKTQKGRGDPRSESCPEKTHGISISGQRRVSYSAAFGEKVCQLAERNPKIMAITAAMADGTGLALFRERYPGRFFDVGIAEGHAITFAAGLSKAGLLPVCAIYSTFLQRAFDQIFHDIALQNLPIIIGIDRAGLCASDGPTHHGLFDIAFLRAIPGLIVMQPKDPRELGAMLEAAVTFNAPCCIRYPRETDIFANGDISDNNNNQPAAPAEIQLGQSEVIARGTDIFTNGGISDNNNNRSTTSAEIQPGRSEVIARGTDTFANGDISDNNNNQPAAPAEIQLSRSEFAEIQLGRSETIAHETDIFAGNSSDNNNNQPATPAGIQLGQSEIIAREIDIFANGDISDNNNNQPATSVEIQLGRSEIIARETDIFANGGSSDNNHQLATPAEIQLGRSEIIARGTDICLIALGEKVGAALEIARRLPQLSFTVVNARFVKPLDGAMLAACARRHRFIYTIEDHVKSGGFGSAAVEFLAGKNLAKHIHIFAWPDAFISHASCENDLKKMFRFTVADMVEKIRADQNTAVD
jgi:1-deoxy-D-xylulose-5-phosphate synthase